MGIIALINQKGGSGKSTSSVHLAYWLQFKQNYRVLLVDADAQRSSSQWVAGMGIELACQVIQSPDDILEKIPELIKDYDYLVIDGPASLSEAQSVRGGLPKGLVFLSRAVKNTKLKQEAIALLSQIPDAKFLKPIIHQKQAIADTSGQSLTVWDLPGQAASEAAIEYDRLFKAILKQLPEGV
ncbi:AAA family ATPase [Planktothrix agardhii 1029]|uniref:AAA family ATPase n=1 Tax=Planktothrix agardhii TaxID=1160 RepID=UPI001F157957|nr:AAA family ATPase [Planktothrix agardhii]MCF3592315.1 AAA family ATPase [Planktothrix agardhii 1029]